ncbi:SEC-C metal-binding domain-containing protein [Cobetia marina]|uniref:SEC-C metal-binding domain-containing protein n=1 Tax=Cobetia marina TaxID=28258 RepID=UPI003A917DCA
MNDVDFALSVSPQLGELYRQAKDLAPITPGHALTFLRSFAVIFCETLDPNTKPEQNLNSRINSTLNSGLASEKVLARLRLLQSSGNKAAHPEEYDWTTLDLPAMVEEGLSAARYLLEHLYWLAQGSATQPVYTVTEDTVHSQMKLSFRAVFEEDSEARYTLGIHFKEMADRLNATDVMFYADNGYGFNSRPVINQAIHWFQIAADSSHAGAMFEYGSYLTQLKGDGIVDERRKGALYVARASNEGHADAQALMGDFYFSGPDFFEKDLKYARESYLQAASQSHPRALAQLGLMHERGLGGPIDFDAALQCSLQSAAAGFPQAQFHLYTLHIQGQAFVGDEPRAINWLIAAAEQKYPDAMLALADLITQKRVPGRTIIEAQALYEQCIYTPGTRVKSLYALADQLSTHTEEFDVMNKALSYAFSCKDEILNNPEYQYLLQGCEEIIRTLWIRINESLVRTYPQLANPVPVVPYIPHRLTYSGPSVGRNVPCPCGSQKKYKHCCI